MQFEWDENKNAVNLKKHGISFGRASTIFDGFVLSRIDNWFYPGEERDISIGMIEGGRVVVIVHVERNSKIRIISARKATKKERKLYYVYYHKKAK